MPYSFLATAAFGLEGIVSNELKRLGFSAKAEQGCARFSGELADGFRANLCLRSADRVLLLWMRSRSSPLRSCFSLLRPFRGSNIWIGSAASMFRESACAVSS